MELPEPFELVGDHVGIELPGGRALFTTRRGGVSTTPYASLNLGRWTDDDPRAVAENRRRAAAAVGLSPQAIAQGRQVHGAVVETVCHQPDPHATPTESDGQATSLRDVATLVLTADCLPIALISSKAVAVVHAGWRGLAGGVIQEGVRALRDLGADGQIAAAIGPGAGPCCYEVGDEVRAAFNKHGDAVLNGNTIDLKAIAARELRAAGVKEVHDCGLCTMCTDPSLFFSHRRDGGLTGRQAGLAWRA